jgi:hypothetical protein
MKKPSSGIGFGLWVLGGILALYVASGLLIYNDQRSGNLFFGRVSRSTTYLALRIYSPLFFLIEYNRGSACHMR